MAANTATQKQTLVLPEGYQPTDDVVVIGRGKMSQNHLGNKRFRDLINRMLHAYANAPGKTEKSYIVSKALHTIRSWHPERIGFVKHNSRTGLWHSPKDSVARITVAQAFRDSLSSHYKSSRDNKMRKRQQARGFVESRNDVDTVLSSFKMGEMKKNKLSNISAQDALFRTKGIIESRPTKTHPELFAASSLPIQGGMGLHPSGGNGSGTEMDGLTTSLLGLSHYPFRETEDPYEPIPIKEGPSSHGEFDALLESPMLRQENLCALLGL